MKRVEDGVEEIADAAAVLGGDGEERLHAEAAEVFCLREKLVGVDFIDGEEDGLAGADEQARELDVRRGELGAAVDDHDDELRFVECGAGLAEDFSGDEIRVVRDDAAGVDEARGASGPFDFAVDAVAGDAGLVADDGAAAAGEAIEERGLADVGAAADGEDGQIGGGDAGLIGEDGARRAGLEVLVDASIERVVAIDGGIEIGGGGLNPASGGARGLTLSGGEGRLLGGLRFGFSIDGFAGARAELRGALPLRLEARFVGLAAALVTGGAFARGLLLLGLFRGQRAASSERVV